MTDQVVSPHLHRGKMDGSHDLLCLNCLGTINASLNDGGMVERDGTHICHSSFPPKRKLGLQVA
jgi:hypothetical protein